MAETAERSLGPDSSMTYLIAKVGHQLALRVDRAVRAEGLTLTQFSALEHLRAQPGMSGADLARALLTSPQAASTLIQRLSVAGFVENAAGPSERGRLGSFVLTELGTHRLAAAEGRAVRAESDALAVLDAETVAALTGGLTRILASLE